ncbi:hypothetical protein [Rothia sp. P7208]|uniref:hypothetical protein n=1 Tax=Rothia sp. P7208 TaxID=3402660 RepID=UPI003AC3BCA1
MSKTDVQYKQYRWWIGGLALFSVVDLFIILFLSGNCLKGLDKDIHLVLYLLFYFFNVIFLVFLRELSIHMIEDGEINNKFNLSIAKRLLFVSLIKIIPVISRCKSKKYKFSRGLEQYCAEDYMEETSVKIREVKRRNHRLLLNDLELKYVGYRRRTASCVVNIKSIFMFLNNVFMLISRAWLVMAILTFVIFLLLTLLMTEGNVLIVFMLYMQDSINEGNEWYTYIFIVSGMLFFALIFLAVPRILVFGKVILLVLVSSIFIANNYFVDLYDKLKYNGFFIIILILSVTFLLNIFRRERKERHPLENLFSSYIYVLMSGFAASYSAQVGILLSKSPVSKSIHLLTSDPVLVDPKPTLFLASTTPSKTQIYSAYNGGWLSLVQDSAVEVFHGYVNNPWLLFSSFVMLFIVWYLMYQIFLLFPGASYYENKEKENAKRCYEILNSPEFNKRYVQDVQVKNSGKSFLAKIKQLIRK